MTQSTDLTFSNQSGASYRAEHNSINQALGSTHKGGTAPTYAITGIQWIDDSSTPWVLKVYDGADWISITEINATTNTHVPVSLGDGDSTTDGANIGQIQDGDFTWLGTSSGTDTITASATPTIDAYKAGQLFKFLAGGTNTGAVTLNVNSKGAKAIQKLGSALVAGDITANDVVTVVYDGTQFQMISPTRTPKSASTATDGQVLTADGSGGAAWESSEVGGTVLLGSYTASNATSVDIGDGLDLDAAIDDTYEKYVIECMNVLPATGGTSMHLLTSSDTGTTFDNSSGDYDWGGWKVTVDDSITLDKVGAQDSKITLTTQVGSISGYGADCTVELYNPYASLYTRMINKAVSSNLSAELVTQHSGSMRNEIGVVDAVRIYMSTDNIASGTFYLYGVRKS